MFGSLNPSVSELLYNSARIMSFLSFPWQVALIIYNIYFREILACVIFILLKNGPVNAYHLLNKAKCCGTHLAHEVCNLALFHRGNICLLLLLNHHKTIFSRSLLKYASQRPEHTGLGRSEV